MAFGSTMHTLPFQEATAKVSPHSGDALGTRCQPNSCPRSCSNGIVAGVLLILSGTGANCITGFLQTSTVTEARSFWVVSIANGPVFDWDFYFCRLREH